jgi:hypothetical protein
MYKYRLDWVTVLGYPLNIRQIEREFDMDWDWTYIFVVVVTYVVTYALLFVILPRLIGSDNIERLLGRLENRFGRIIMVCLYMFISLVITVIIDVSIDIVYDTVF